MSDIKLDELSADQQKALSEQLFETDLCVEHIDKEVGKRLAAEREERMSWDRYGFDVVDTELGRHYLAGDFAGRKIGLDNSSKSFKARKSRILELNNKADFLSEALQNNGRVSHMPGRQFSFNDLTTTADAPLLIPKVVSNIVKEPMEIESNLLGLFDRIEYHNGTELKTPVMGAAQGRNLEVAEGAEYNELVSEFAGYMVATIAKQGIKVSVTDEVIRYSILDLFSLYLRHAGKAMGRWKETKAARSLLGSAKVVFDNNTPTNGILGRPTSGRNRSGYLNGTFMLQDLFDVWSLGNDQGSNPRVVIMNAFAWKIFATDPILKGFIFSNQGGIFKPWDSGNAGRYNAGGGGLSNVMGGTEKYSIAAPNLDTRKSNVPGALGVPFEVMVTPFIPATKSTVTVNGVPSTEVVTDIIICDPDDVGLYVVDEDLTSESFEDPQRDIRSTKMRERYGFASNNAGNGLYIVKNVVVTRGYDFENGVSWQVNAPTLETGNPTVVQPGIPGQL